MMTFQICARSLSIRNAGSADVPLDWVKLQRHQFAATSDPNRAWTAVDVFKAPALKWGEGRNFPDAREVHQENPFGAPVPTKDDLGAVGGAFRWWRSGAAKWARRLATWRRFLYAIDSGGDDSGGKSRDSGACSCQHDSETGRGFSNAANVLAVYRGDFYQPLSLWSRVVAKEGLEKPRNNEENYAVSWCGWATSSG